MQVIALEEVDGGRPERAKVLALARAPKIDAILVTELGRWGRSTQDLVQTLDDLHGWKVSVLAQTGLSFDLSTASGKLMRTIMAGLAEFERDLIRDRVKSALRRLGPGVSNSGVKLANAPQTRRPNGCSACMPTGCPIGSSRATSV
jgi:putative DNA-invertase from lambdoid prophage Rac